MYKKIKKVRPLRMGRRVEQGVALVIVLIFLSLMLLLGLATTMTSITEVEVGTNLRLATEAFDVADAGASHAYQLVRNMRGDFTCLMRGEDGVLKSGDEFAQRQAEIYENDGTLGDPVAGDMFVDTAVSPIPKHPSQDRALHQLNPTHFYELIAYDNADDPNSYLNDSTLEQSQDTSGSPISVDADGRALIRSIGYVMASSTDYDDFDPNNAISTAVVDIVIGLNPFPAVISNDDLDLTNSIAISGSLGSAHANDDLLLGTGNFTIAQSATFSNGDPSHQLNPQGGVLNDTSDNTHVAGYNGRSSHIEIPSLNPYEYADRADYLFVHSGSTADQRRSLLTWMPQITSWLTANGLTANDFVNLTPGGHLVIFSTPGEVAAVTDIRVLDGSTTTGATIAVTPPPEGRTVASAEPTWKMKRLDGSGWRSETVAWTRGGGGNGGGNGNGGGGNGGGGGNTGGGGGGNANSFSFAWDSANAAASTLSVGFTNQNGMTIDDIPDAGFGRTVFCLLPPGNADVRMNSNMNGQVSVLTTGNVHMNGNATLSPALRLVRPSRPPWDRLDILVMTAEDITMNGNAAGGDLIEGILYAHEQFDLSGSGNLRGQVIGYERELVYNAISQRYEPSGVVSSASNTPVGLHGSVLSGNFSISHDVIRGYLGQFTITAWRQLRDFDPITAPRPAP